MALDYDNQEQPEDDIFPVDSEEQTELDRYGVWIKQKPQEENRKADNVEDELIDIVEEDEPLIIDDTYDDVIDIDDSEDLAHEEIIEFDDIEEFTELPEIDMSDLDEPLEKKEPENNFSTEEEIINIDEPIAEQIQDEEEERDEDMEINDFETLDLDDFLNDDEIVESSETKPKEKVEESESPELEETSEFDDLLSDLGSDNTDSTSTVEKDENENIDMNITIDEDSDIASIAGKGVSDEESLDAISIFDEGEALTQKEDLPKEEVVKEEPTAKDDDIVIESTIIEADNMDAIREENEKILNQTTESPEVEDEEELSSLDSMLDDVMGIETPSKDTEVSFEDSDDEFVFEDVKENDAPAFVLDELDSDDMVINFDDDSSDSVEIPDSIEIPDEKTEIIEESVDLTEEKPEVPEENVDLTEEKLEVPEETVEDNESIFFNDVDALEKDMMEADLPSEDNNVATDLDESPHIETVSTEAPELAQVTNATNGGNVQPSGLQNDKATEILMQIAGELSSIKTELSNLKSEMAMKANIEPAPMATQASFDEVPINEEKATSTEENSGFFSDDDSDETIALTGDELNNILITADFTEKQAEEDAFIPESIDEEIETKSEIEDSSASDFEIPEVLDESVTNSYDDEKDADILDDAAIIRKLPTEPVSTVTDDISYLDEKDGEVIDDTPEDYIDIPDFSDEDIEEPNLDNFDLTISELELPNGQSITLGQPDENIHAIDTEDFDDITFDDNIIDNEEPLSVEDKLEANISDEEEIFDPNELDSAAEEIPHLELETNTAEQHKLDVPEVDESAEAEKAVLDKQGALPIHLKEEIKSVLSYMDQLLESLPENKIEEFAKSEYFDTYKRLFDELGIS